MSASTSATRRAPVSVSTVDDCVQAIRRIYAAGDAPAGDLAAQRGVVHVASVWDGASSGAARAPRVLRLGDAAPSSPVDAFVLALARARADAIVTTGEILRREPDLSHAPSAVHHGLAQWRREVLGKRDRPRSVVLTGRPDLDFDHPVFAAGGSPPVLVVTSERNARSLAERLARSPRSAGPELIARARPGLRDTVAWLLEREGIDTVVVEAGPSSAASLYADPVLVDELMLSIYRSDALPAEARGGSFATWERIDEIFAGSPGPSGGGDDRGERWTFHRLRRRARRGRSRLRSRS